MSIIGNDVCKLFLFFILNDLEQTVKVTKSLCEYLLVNGFFINAVLYYNFMNTGFRNV